MTIRQHRRPPRSDGACLVVVTRVPGAAASKTRLAAGIGEDACRRLQDAFLDDTLAWARELTLRRVVSVHPPEWTEEVSARAPGWVVVPQLGAEFGERMREAFNAGFAVAPGPVAMIATDSPTLPPDRIEQAWEAVGGAAADVALAPAHDGGWVLIAAASTLPPGCFAGVRWSAEVTLADTEAALRRCQLRSTRLDPWYDVDTAADLQRLAAELRADAGQRLPRTRAALEAPA
jgi:rSAM/selenodomain-associated transferase 1